jgi:hypothetical protein
MTETATAGRERLLIAVLSLAAFAVVLNFT